MSTISVNQQLRLARGEHDAIVITAAWCDRCGTEVMPSPAGLCNLCRAPIVDEDALPAKRLLELLETDGFATYTADPSNGSTPGPVAPAPQVSEASSTRRPRRRAEYDRDEIREQLLAFHAQHGREPTFKDLKEHAAELPPGLAAVEWREVALDLGWADPAAPKRRRRAASLGREPRAPVERVPTPTGSRKSPPSVSSRPEDTALDRLTTDDLWLLYDSLNGGVAPSRETAAVSQKLRRLIEAGA